jgi:hypothetical protein
MTIFWLTRSFSNGQWHWKQIPHMQFKDEVWSYWPKVDLGQIFSFVLSRREQDMEFVGHYKSQRAALEANSSYALSSMKPEKQNKVYQYGQSSQI